VKEDVYPRALSEGRGVWVPAFALGHLHFFGATD
jgi:hypothetical protein